MCIGIPKQVRSTGPGHALVAGAQGPERVNTALVGDCQPGDWVLVFLGSARERISPERAAEVQATLALVQDSMAGRYDPLDPAAAAFALPSAMSAVQLATLVGATAPARPFQGARNHDEP